MADCRSSLAQAVAKSPAHKARSAVLADLIDMAVAERAAPDVAAAEDSQRADRHGVVAVDLTALCPVAHSVAEVVR